jgi:hypothetical protein
MNNPKTDRLIPVQFVFAVTSDGYLFVYPFILN